jgi:hypothetical protein
MPPVFHKGLFVGNRRVVLFGTFPTNGYWDRSRNSTAPTMGADEASAPRLVAAMVLRGWS